MIQYDSVCAYCGSNIEHQNSIKGKTLRVCKYGTCTNDLNNCKYRVKNFVAHKDESIRIFAKIVQGMIDERIPVFHYDSQLKIMAKMFRKSGIVKLPQLGSINR